VAEPVKMPPKFSPATQMTAAAATARITAARAAGAGRKMPMAMISKATARRAEACQPGWPDAMSCIPCGAVPAAWSAR
jgi:hypothetical protein